MFRFPPFGFKLPQNLKDTRHLDEASRYDLLSQTIPDFIFSDNNPLIWQNRIRFPYISRKVGNVTGKRVADVGCGWGFLTRQLAMLGCEVTGIDISRDTLRLAAEQESETKTDKLNYVQAKAEDLPFAERFDIVTATDLLEHVESPEVVIAEVSRILKPGGRFLFVTVNKTFLARLVYLTFGEDLLKLLPRGTHYYDKFVEPRRLEQFMMRYRLEMRDLQGILVNPFFKRYHFWPSKAIEYMGMAEKVD
jgi:2-polyprenyl-6-hydroxyphenyl methylase/3-demethylubiquinone-9 3-methyltransferase